MVRLCLFIDGLDEYHPHDEHQQLVHDINELASLPNAKICVSSRPWDVFQRSFVNSQQMFVMEDMTRKDILLHVWDELRAAEKDADMARGDFSSQNELATSIVNLIADDSQGVFLWVHLIVRALRERITCGQSLHTLQRYVVAFPRQLEDYFRHLIYERISPTWREHSETACALKLASILINSREDLDDCGERSFINFWLLKEYDNLSDPDFSKSISIRNIPHADLQKQLSRTCVFLDASCRDLLTVTTRNLKNKLLKNPITTHVVEFMHRTVYDFIMTDDMQRLIDSRVPAHFESPTFLPSLAIARTKIVPMNQSPLELCFYHVKSSERICTRLPNNSRADLWREVEETAKFYLRSFCRRNCQVHKRSGYVSSVPELDKLLAMLEANNRTEYQELMGTIC